MAKAPRNYAAEYRARTKSSKPGLSRSLAGGHKPSYYRELSAFDQETVRDYLEDHPRTGISSKNITDATKFGDHEVLKRPWRAPEKAALLTGKLVRYASYRTSAAQGLANAAKRVGSPTSPEIELYVGYAVVIPFWVGQPGGTRARRPHARASLVLWDTIDAIGTADYIQIAIDPSGMARLYTK